MSMSIEFKGKILKHINTNDIVLCVSDLTYFISPHTMNCYFLTVLQKNGTIARKSFYNIEDVGIFYETLMD